MKKRLLLVRHASPETDAHRFLGRTDVCLNEAGRRQALALAASLPPHQPSRCFCSPLKRCIETIRPASSFQPELDPDLREIDFGRWEGMTFDEIQRSDPQAVNQWAAFDPDFSFPGGERIDDFLCRVRRAADRLAALPEQTVLAVTHGGVIRAMICHFLGLSPRHYVLFEVGYASLTTLDLFDGKGVLTGLNQRVEVA